MVLSRTSWSFTADALALVKAAPKIENISMDNFIIDWILLTKALCPVCILLSYMYNFYLPGPVKHNKPLDRASQSFIPPGYN
jgi:hypothetical protein